jgi:glycosyltransferase involved in cell wall biosynthesis
MLVDLYRFASTSLRRLNKGMDDEVIGIHLGKGGSALLLRDNVLLKTASPASADATDQASATLPVTGLLSVAMPAYNERETLREIITRVRAVPVRKEIIIVDDGSTDGTREILQEEIEGKYPDVRVLYHTENRGKGAAICTAIAHAQGEYLIVQDADLEYDPAEYLKLLPLIESGQADVVYGSRCLGSIRKMRFTNLVANKLLTWGTNILYPGAKITDEATCYKVFRLDLLKKLPLRSRRFDFCPEVTAKTLKRGYKIHEVPINYVARTEQQGKKIRWTDGFDALWTLIKYRFID